MCTSALRQLGWKEHEFKEFPGMAHSTCPEEISMIVEFLKKVSESPSKSAPGDGAAEDVYLRVPHTDKNYPVGHEVVICGLKSKPELNDTTGSIEAFDRVKGRYAVKVEKTGETVSLQGVNLIARYSDSENPEHICGKYWKITGLK